MKKVLLVMLVVSMVLVGVFSGCTPAADTAATDDTAAEDTATDDTAAEDTAAADDAADAPKEKIYLGMAIRSLTNPYYIQLQEGAEMFADWLIANGQDAEVVMLVSDGSDEKQLSDINAFIAAHGENCILYVDPNNAPNAIPIAEACEDNGVYWETTWSTAEDIKIKDFEYYVFHQTLDDRGSGYAISKAMFEQFDTPGEGKVLAIQGMLANSAAINRFKGLEDALAEYPGVELLDDQAGDWDPQKAYTIAETWLSKYDDIAGIWVANDSMALAVVELLEAKGLIGDVKVVGVDGIPDAVTAIQEGKMTATVYSDPYKQGGGSLAYLYQIWMGNIAVSSLTDEQRCFLTEGVLVTADTVDAFANSTPEFDYGDPQTMIYKLWDIPAIQD